MTPIEKNISVIDKQGNKYEATYPKRAKGLVKHGRARFVDENTICLACPPSDKTEDNKMLNDTSINTNNPNSDDAYAPQNPQYTVEYILKCLEDLRSENSRSFEKSVEQFEDIGSVCSDDTEAACTFALQLGNAIKAHETTTQSFINTYKEMYNRLCDNTSARQSIVDIAKYAIENNYEIDFKEVYDTISKI